MSGQLSAALHRIVRLVMAVRKAVVLRCQVHVSAREWGLCPTCDLKRQRFNMLL